MPFQQLRYLLLLQDSLFILLETKLMGYLSKLSMHHPYQALFLMELQMTLQDIEQQLVYTKTQERITTVDI